MFELSPPSMSGLINPSSVLLPFSIPPVGMCVSIPFSSPGCRNGMGENMGVLAPGGMVESESPLLLLELGEDASPKREPEAGMADVGT